MLVVAVLAASTSISADNMDTERAADADVGRLMAELKHDGVNANACWLIANAMR